MLDFKLSLVRFFAYDLEREASGIHCVVSNLRSAAYAYPWASLLVGTVFFVVFAQRKRISAVLAGLLWTGYSGYEYLMLTRVLCSGECNIRIDLLLIYPLLVIISVVAIVQMLRKDHK